jgi:hypothetical protein
MKYTSKAALLDDIRVQHDELVLLLDAIPDRDQRTARVWGDGWSPADLVAHLAEWQRLLIGWHTDGRRGVRPAMPAPGYTWRETPRLNRDIQRKHADRAPLELRAELESGHRRILELVERLSPEELLEPGRLAWTGRSSLATYVAANTASHYRFAIRVIRRWRRQGPSPNRK